MPFCPYKVDFFGVMKIFSPTFSLFTISLSVIVQIFLFMSLSSLGDFGPNRKIILLQSGFCGAGALMAMYICDDPSKYMLCSWLTIICNSMFGLSIVMYNAYLPYLTKSHPKFQEKMKGERAKRAASEGAIIG